AVECQAVVADECRERRILSSDRAGKIRLRIEPNETDRDIRIPREEQVFRREIQKSEIHLALDREPILDRVGDRLRACYPNIGTRTCEMSTLKCYRRCTQFCD